MKEREPKNKFLEAALFYAQRMGWPVFPLAPRTKVPLKGSKGCLDATTNEKQIRLWWEIEPAANVATPTGLSFWVLDSDPRNGGDQSLMQLVAKHGALADTLQQVTGGGGGQRFYRPPEGIKIGCHNGVWPGIDVKAEGGYVVTPPSVHPDTGKEYFWDTGKRTILEETISLAPKWLIDEILQSAHANEESGPVELPERLEKGARDQTIYRMACAFRRARAEYDDVLKHLTEYDQKHCVPPLGAKIIKAKVDSAWKKPPGAREDGPTSDPQAQLATVDLNRLDASLDLLNSLAVWHGRIRIISVKRRGPMIIATTDTKTEIIWPTTTDLGSFSKSQAIVSDATSIWMPTPPHRQIRSQWEPAVHLLLQLSAKDGMRLESPLKEEVRDLLRLMWDAASQPAAEDGGQFIEYIRVVRRARRNPAGTIPPCVFVAEESTWVHVPALRTWLSIPALTNKLYPLADIRNGLMLLGFAYFENLSRGFEGDSETACLWRGPLEVLET